MDMEKSKHMQQRLPSSSSPSLSKAANLDRKTVEKKRREEMKSLFTTLNSLLPQPPQAAGSSSSSSSTDHRTSTDQIEAATTYLKELKTQLERLREKKRSLSLHNPTPNTSSMTFESRLAKVEVHGRGNSALEVVLITGLDCYNIFKEAIRVIHDQGVDVVNASFSGVDHDSIFHTIHGKIEESAEHQGIVERISERLKLMLLSLAS